MNRLRRGLLSILLVNLVLHLFCNITTHLLASNVGLFYDDNYVEIEDGNLFAEASNLKSSLEYLGHNVVIFNDFSNLDPSTIDLIIIPELERKSLLQGSGSFQVPALKSYIHNGGGVLIMGVVASSSINNDNGINLMNELCDSKLEGGEAVLEGTCSKSINLLPGMFDKAPDIIANNNAVVYLEKGFSEGVKIIYHNTANPGSVAVAQIPAKKGSVIYFGWGWWNAFPIGSQDGGWLDLLEETIMELECASPLSNLETDYTFQLNTEGVLELDPEYFKDYIKACTNIDLSLSKSSFNCEDVGKKHEVFLKVVDELGRTLLFSTSIQITDPDSNCLSPQAVYFSGNVHGPNGLGIKGVAVELQSEVPRVMQSNELGDFKSDEPISGEYHAKISKEDYMAKGVTNLDLVLLSRHIMGVEKFTNPYQYLAGDINGDKILNVMDMVIMQKLILHQKISENIVPNWIFLDSRFIFNSLHNPLHENWNTLQGISINTVRYNLDVVAIKSGDVNFSCR